MAESFDPYRKWLGILPKDQPPNHYRLLGIELFESDPDVIEGAADRQMAHLRTFQAGPHSTDSQKLLNECAAARVTLLDTAKRAEYDRQLRAKLASVENGLRAVPQADSAVLPLPPGEGRGEGGLPRSQPQPLTSPVPPLASPMPIAKPSPAAKHLPMAEVVPIIDDDGRTSSVTGRPYRKTPLWRQPVVLGAAGAGVIFAAIAIALIRGGNLPTELETTQTAPNTAGPEPSALPEIDKPASPSVKEPTTDVAGTPAAVERPAEKPAASQADFEILEATWGINDKWVDVTDGVRGAVKDNRLMMIVWSGLFGKPADPAPGVAKKLRIRYRSRGKEYTAEYFDLWFVYLDGNPLAPPTDSPDAVELLEARYGAGGTFVDVLPRLRPHLRNGRLSVCADEFAGETAAELEKNGIGPNIFKVLWIRYRNATGEHFTYAWNSAPIDIQSRPAAAGPPVDLLKQIDLNRDVVEGVWTMDNGVLRAPGTQFARVELPYDPPEEYMLTVTAEGESEIKDIGGLLVVGGQQVMAVIDGFQGNRSGVQAVSGKLLSEDNPTCRWRSARLLEQGRPNTLVYIVRPHSVRVLRDGAEIIRWSGNPKTLSIPDRWEIGNSRRLSLQAFDTPFRVSKLELTPLKPQRSPMIVLSESGSPVDMLAAIDLDRDRLKGNWQYNGQTLVSPSNQRATTQFQLPAIVPADYQLDLVAQRESGGDCLSLTFPIAGTSATLIVDGGEGKLSGLQAIDGKNFMANETTREAQVFADGKPHPVHVRVQKNHVRVYCDGKPLIDWEGDVSRLKASENVPYPDRIYLGNWYSRYRLTTIKLRALRGDAQDEPPPALASGPVDLLKQIDVARDRVNGDWKLENAALLSPKQPAARIQLPFAPSGDYELTVLAERLSGNDSFILGLVIGGQQVAMTLDGYGGETSGLADLDHHDGEHNETTRRGRRLPPGKPHTVVCAVRGNSLRVTCDGQEAMAWSGDASRLSNSVFLEMPDKERMYLAAWESEFRYTRIDVKPLPRESEPKKEKPPPRTFADLGSGKEPRLPVPDDEAQKEVRKEMQKKFGGARKAAKTPEQKRDLAQELAQKAVVDDKVGASAYVLLKEAIDLAEAAGELDLAWKTIDQLAKTFDVEGMTLRNQSLTEIGKGARSPAQAWQLTDAACRLITVAFSAGDAASVKKAASHAQSFAKRTKDTALQKEVNTRAADAAKLAAEIEAVAAARETLKTSPDDPQANLTVGHYELCASGDFDAALPKLAEAADEKWKKLATDELALANRQPTGRREFINGRLVTRSEPADAQKELAVADAWWSRADDEPWPGKHYLRMRAAKWYNSAYRSLVDAGRTRAAERLKTLLATDDGFPNWELFKWRGIPNGQPSGEVVRLERGGSGLETAVEYAGPVDATLMVRTTGTELHFMANNMGYDWKFKLLPNQWHTVRYVFTPISRTAFVDGVPVENDTYRTPRQFNSGPVYIYVSNDDVVEIKKFIVKGG